MNTEGPAPNVIVPVGRVGTDRRCSRDRSERSSHGMVAERLGDVGVAAGAHRVADILDPGPGVQPGGLRPRAGLARRSLLIVSTRNEPSATVLRRCQARRRATDTLARRWRRADGIRAIGLLPAARVQRPLRAPYRRTWGRFPPIGVIPRLRNEVFQSINHRNRSQGVRQRVQAIVPDPAPPTFTHQPTTQGDVFSLARSVKIASNRSSWSESNG